MDADGGVQAEAAAGLPGEHVGGDAVILEPVKKRAWPEGYWEWLERHHADLELGEVEPMPAAFLDVVMEEEG